jgi:hypothetical protein
MTPALDHLLTRAPALASYRDEDDPEVMAERMARQLGVASSGERVMLSVALSLMPDVWLSEAANAAVRRFRLGDISPLDADNARLVIEAIAIATGYPEAAGLAG